MLSLYFHIPYCSKICPYCDFNTYAVKNVPEEQYAAALCKELELLADTYNLEGANIASIFWGGGTPSLISDSGFQRVHDKASSLFEIDWNSVEVTTEANPINITGEKAVALKEAGMTRVSLGAQSLSERVLSLLGRDHKGSDVRAAVSALRDAGLKSISLDLIFAVPDQTISELTNDLDGFLECSPDHISTYSLTIEKSTPFFKAVSTGMMKPLPDDMVREQYELIISTLTDAGFGHYEVSNFAKENHQCRHNENYWERGSYLGLGAGAHSYLSASKNRWANVGKPEEYMSSIGKSTLPYAWEETLSESDELSESIMLGLRTTKGMNLAEMQQNIAPSQLSSLEAKLLALSEEELGTYQEDRFILTTAGLCVADSIIADLIASCAESDQNLEKD